MKLNKAKNRDKKRHRRKHGMRVSGRSVFIINDAQKKRDEETLKNK